VAVGYASGLRDVAIAIEPIISSINYCHIIDDARTNTHQLYIYYIESVSCIRK